MQLSDIDNKDGLIQHAEQTLFGDRPFGSISSSPERMSIFVNRFNRAMDDFTTLALRNDFRWVFDDSNYGDYPIGTTDLKAGQKDYPLSVEHIIIKLVEMKDDKGNWRSLDPVDIRQLDRGGNLTPSNSKEGTPRWYRKLDQAVLLYPTPEKDIDGGLRVHFQRPPSYFTVEEVTKQPGIPSIFHPYVYLHACTYYAEEKDMAIAPVLRQRLNVLEADRIPTFYGKRAKDERKRMVGQRISSH